MEQIIALLDIGEFSQGLELIKERQQYSTDPALFWLEAAALRSLGFLEDAIKPAKTALHLNPCVETHKLLANIYIDLRMFKDALFVNDECIRLYKDIEAIRMRTLLLMSIKDYKKAIKNAKTVLKYYPNDPLIYHDISHCYLFLGKLKKAKKYNEIALSYGDSKELYLFRNLIEREMRSK